MHWRQTNLARQVHSIVPHICGEKKNTRKELGMNPGPLGPHAMALATRPWPLSCCDTWASPGSMSQQFNIFFFHLSNSVRNVSELFSIGLFSISTPWDSGIVTDADADDAGKVETRAFPNGIIKLWGSTTTTTMTTTECWPSTMLTTTTTMTLTTATIMTTTMLRQL